MWWLYCSSTSEGGLCGRGRNGVRCRVRPPRPARRLPRARLTVRLRTGCNCCLCRRSCYHRPCLVVLCLLLPPPPPSLVPFPFHPGPWTRDWDDPARSQIFTATLLGTGATAGCAPAAPAGLYVRRRWMPPVAAAGGNGSFSVGDVGIGADDDGDGDGIGDGDDNVHRGGPPPPGGAGDVGAPPRRAQYGGTHRGRAAVEADVLSPFGVAVSAALHLPCVTYAPAVDGGGGGRPGAASAAGMTPLGGGGVGGLPPLARWPPSLSPARRAVSTLAAPAPASSPDAGRLVRYERVEAVGRDEQHNHT